MRETANLAARTDNLRNLEETFTYDHLNRLTDVWLNNVHTGHMAYDALGRMTDKRTDGQNVFSAAQHDYIGPDGQLRPHAVSSAQVLGNPFPTEQLDIDYTMFDKVRRIADGIFSPTTVELEYGYDHQRTRMRVENPDDSRYGKTYVDGCEFVEHNGIVDMYTYLCGPLGVFAVNKLEVNGCHFVDRLHYVYKDHLGSWTTITDANGNIIREQSFDAWGNMRDPDTWTGTVTQQPMFDRGFTGHEHLNSFGLINMNGRMYDPVMSSFLSVDNYVQCPDFSQNFNRYAYCLNNPLKYTDPSGEIHVLAVVAIGAAVTVITNGINNVRHGENFFHGAGQAAVTGGVQALFTYGIGESAGALARDIMELGKSAAWANVAQAGFQIVSHGTMGGMSTMSRGGKFWHGFVSSATASVMSTAINQTCIHFQLSEGLTKTAMIAGGALSGGISAKMAGGDFIDGFCNGLISAGLNHALHFVVQNTPKIVKVLHELKNFENAMQKDRGPRMTSHYNMCKYAVMEAIAKYSGVSDADQWDYKDIGERFIKWEKANNRPEPLLSSVFEKCGFSVGIVPEDRIHELWPKALDNGKPVVFDYMADDNTRHTATLIALGRDAGGNLMYRLADPMLGVYECQAEQIQVNASYVFYGMK